MKLISGWILLTFDTFLLIMCISWMWSPFIYLKFLENSLTLEEGSSLFDLWSDRSHLMHKRVYIFNITNADEVKSGADKKMEEVGPLTFSLEWKKQDFKWLSNGTLSFTRRSTLRFISEMSVVDENERIYAFDIALLSGFGDDNSNSSHRGRKAIINTSIKQYLTCIFGIQEGHGPDLPQQPCCGILGSSRQDAFVVDTGKYILSNLNLLYDWNGYNSTSSQNEEKNISVTRSSWELGPPLEQEQGIFQFLDPGICHDLIFIKSRTVDSGRLRHNMFEMLAKDQNTEVSFCRSEGSGNQHFSFLVSSPHFYAGNSIRHFSVLSGLEPNKSLHNSYLLFEAVTGLTISFKLRYQINVRLLSNGDKSWAADIKDGIYPWIMIEESGTASEELERFLHQAVIVPHFILHSPLSWVVFFVSFGAVALSATWYFSRSGGMDLVESSTVEEEEESTPLLKGKVVKDSYSTIRDGLEDLSGTGEQLSCQRDASGFLEGMTKRLDKCVRTYLETVGVDDTELKRMASNVFLTLCIYFPLVCFISWKTSYFYVIQLRTSVF